MEVNRKDLMLKSALEYLDAGYSIIPCGLDKKPFLKWESYQKKRPTKIEVLDWWGVKYPEANIGLITGKISGVCAIDVDDVIIKHKDITDLLALEPPIAKTPRGGKHIIFANPDVEVRNTTGFLDKVDFRGEGGYILVAPSKNGGTNAYAWERDIFTTDLTKLPSNIIKLINKNIGENFGKTEDSLVIPETSPCHHDVTTMTKSDNFKENLQKVTRFFHEGRRDEDIFHTAHVMLKGGGNPQFITDVLRRLSTTCSPPFSIKDADEKIRSAMARVDRKAASVADEVRAWVKYQDGYFTTTECFAGLNASTKTEKNNINVILKRLCDKEKIIAKFGAKSGCYRVIDNESSVINWEEAPTMPMSIKWPLQMEELVETYPSNIIVIAGTANSGKTSVVLDFARMNCDRYPINYFNSEMGPSELRIRLDKFENTTRDTWRKINFEERNSNFADVIRPDEINIIDYMEVLTDFWKIGEMISAIHSKLKKGIAVIAIQKNKGAELGRGGALGTEKPRLYCSLEFGKISIVKAKNWKAHENPNGMCRKFKLAGGWRFIPDGLWVKEEQNGR